MKRALDKSDIAGSSNEINKEIKKNIAKFRKEKVCFIYGTQGKGRYICADDNGKIKDWVKEIDHLFDEYETPNKVQPSQQQK